MSKKRCHQCGSKKWGMIRYRWNLHSFCSRKCLDRYKAWLAEQLALRRYLGWLYARPP